jgi:hypothetical protein
MSGSGRAIAVLCMLGALGAAAEAPGEPVVGISVAWRDLTRTLDPMADEIRAEIVAIFAAADVGVDWRRAAPDDGARGGEISVIVLARPRGRLPEGVMGAVNRNGRREAWVFLSGLSRRLAGRSPAGATGPVDPHELARLAGRVAAHELVHVVAPQLAHTRAGLMQASWARAFAVQPELQLDDVAARALRFALQPTTARFPPGRPEGEVDLL